MREEVFTKKELKTMAEALDDFRRGTPLLQKIAEKALWVFVILWVLLPIFVVWAIWGDNPKGVIARQRELEEKVRVEVDAARDTRKAMQDHIYEVRGEVVEVREEAVKVLNKVEKDHKVHRHDGIGGKVIYGYVN